MRRWTYTYRTSDGQRHSGEIEAESLDAAHAAIRREMGVKPIKVWAAGGDCPCRDCRRRVVVAFTSERPCRR
jgi:type II secretory pathway component PulF